MFNRSYEVGYKYGRSLAKLDYEDINRLNAISPYRMDTRRYMRWREGILNGFLDRPQESEAYKEGYHVGLKCKNQNVLDIGLPEELLNPYCSSSQTKNREDWKKGFIHGSHME